MIARYREIIDEKKVTKRLHEESKLEYTEQLKELGKESKALNEAREIFKKAAVLTQNHLADHLASIVTKALNAVFPEKNLTFNVEFVERRNTSECDMWVEEDGFKYSILDSRGYGLVDVISFSLKVAYILLSGLDNVLIMDEPFRNLDITKHEYASQMVRGLSKELEIQFIIATHVLALKEYADRSFSVVQKAGISEVH